MINLHMHWPLGLVPGPLRPCGVSPSSSVCYTCVWTPCSILQWVQIHHEPMDTTDLIRRDLHACITIMNNVLNISADWVFMYQMHVDKVPLVSGVFWTENLQSLTVGLLLWIVNITEKPCGTIYHEKKSRNNMRLKDFVAKHYLLFSKGTNPRYDFFHFTYKELTGLLRNKQVC